MVAPVASANRASAEDEGSLITIKVNGAKKKRRKDVSRPAIQYGITQASVRGLCWWFDGLVGGERSPDCDAMAGSVTLCNPLDSRIARSLDVDLLEAACS